MFGFALMSMPAQAHVYPMATCQGAFTDPDLGITKTVSAALARPGQVLTYTLQYVNDGPAMADVVIVTDQLPAGVLTASTAASPAWITETFASGVYTWTFGSVPTATVGYITVTVQISGSLADGAVLTNTAEITATGDVTPANNTAWAATTVDALAPTAIITSPAMGVWVQGCLPITGTAYDAHLERYAVDRRPAGGGSWTPIHISTTAVMDDLLATWDTAGVDDGSYVIRLTVTDTVGYVSTDAVTVTVDNTPPTAVIAAPGSGAFVSASLTVTGTAYDLYLVGYTLSYGSWTTPATWTVISTGATSVTGGALGAWDTDGMGDGLYTLRLVVTDTIGHVSTDNVTVTVDNTAPTAAITAPGHNEFVSAAVPITGTATDANFTRYTMRYGSGDDPGSFPYPIGAYTMAVTDGLLATWSSLPPTDGPYTLQLLVHDQAGWTAQVTRTVRVDTQWPTATIAAPAAGALVSGTVEITGTATDRYFGRYEMQYGVGAAPGAWTRIGVVHTNTVTGGHLEVWNTGGVIEEGIYTLRLVVTDTVGHTSVDSRTITVDNRAPTPPSALTITPDTWVATNAFTVSWSTNPFDTSGIAGAYYKLGTAPTSPTDGAYRAGANIKSIPGITAPVDGEYEVHVWLRDGAGNADHESRQSKMAIRYDHTPPAVTLTSPTGGEEWRGGVVHTITWTASDATSGLRAATPITLSYSTDGGGSWATIAVTNNVGSYNWTLPPVDSAQCQVRVQAVDQAGNVGRTQSANFIIDSTTPTATIMSPATGALVSGTVNIVGTADDTHFDHYEVQYGAGTTPDLWTRIGITHTTVIVEDSLETWNTVGLPSGQYTLRLVVTDRAGHVSMDSHIVTVRNVFRLYLPLVLKELYIPPTTWTRSGADGLSIVSLAVHPQDPRVVYAGTSDAVKQGIYKHTACGGGWTQAGLGGRSVYAIAVAPNGWVYAGTYGDYVHRSTDGGANWTRLSMGLGEQYIYALAAHPTNAQVLYAGALTRGIFKTSNGGDTWTAVNNGLGNKEINVLAVGSADGEVVYAGTYGGGIYKTENGGAYWNAKNEGLGNTWVWALVVDSANPSIVYAGTNGGVYRSDNGGNQWNHTPLSVKTRSLAMSGPVLYAGTDSGVYYSGNQGLSWTPWNDSWGGSLPQVNALAADVGPCRTLYAGTSGGVWERGLLLP